MFSYAHPVKLSNKHKSYLQLKETTAVRIPPYCQDYIKCVFNVDNCTHFSIVTYKIFKKNKICILQLLKLYV